MQIKTKKIKKIHLLLIAVAILFGVSLFHFTKAAVTANVAPSGDFGAPITGNTNVPQAQEKRGDLTVRGSVTPTQLCLNGTCISDFTGLGSNAGYAPGSEEITTPGWYSVCIGSATPSGVNCSYHTSDGTTMLHAEIWGGGGGGAVGRSTYNWDYSQRIITGGGAGGSGAWAYADIPVKQNDVIWVNVGAGGTGASNANRNNQDDYTYGGTLGGNSIVYDKNLNMLIQAGGGTGGNDTDHYWTSGNSAGMSFCTPGSFYQGGKASSSIQALSQNGNYGWNCGNYNEDNIPGGAAIKSSKSGKQYGAGANGRYWGQAYIEYTVTGPRYATYEPADPNNPIYGPSCSGDYLGTGTMVTSNFSVYGDPYAFKLDDGTCLSTGSDNWTYTAREVEFDIPASGNNGQNGAAYITW